MAKSVPSEEISKMCREYPNEVLEVLLETPFWPRGLETSLAYQRYEDDARKGNITVAFSNDGDGWIQIDSELDPDEKLHRSHRFRNYPGGGKSLRVHAALQILAIAIKLDNEETPQDQV